MVTHARTHIRMKRGPWAALCALALCALAMEAQPSSPAPAIMPHLLVPTFAHTYNLSKSTMTQTCQAPGGSLDYLREWGVVSYDWSNNAGVWHSDHPNDCDQKMVDQAAAVRVDTKPTNRGSVNCVSAVQALCGRTGVAAQIWCGRCLNRLFEVSAAPRVRACV